MKFSIINRVALAGVALVSLTNAAFALEARAFADKFSQTLKVIGAVEVTFQSAVLDGDNVVLSGLTIPAMTSDRGAQLLDRTLTFVGVAETEQGGYTAQSASFDDLDYTGDGVNLVVRNVTFSDIRIPGDPGENVIETMLLYRGLSAGPISVSIEGDKVFSIDNISANSRYDDIAQEFASTYSVSGIYGDLTKVEERDAAQIIQALGISEMNARLDGEALWSLDDARLNISESSITVENIGKLNLALDIGGYTLTLVETLQGLNQQMSEMDPSSSEFEARNMQMLMGLASGLTLNSASIRFDDDSVTSKLMALIMEKEDITRKEFISGINSAASSVLAILGTPDLEAQIARAVVDFLKEPQSIEISLNPSDPVPFLVLAGGLADPSLAIELLNPKVTANEVTANN